MIGIKRSSNRVFVKLEESCEEMVTFKSAQVVCIANLGKVAEDRRIPVEIGITLNVSFLAQSRR